MLNVSRTPLLFLSIRLTRRSGSLYYNPGVLPILSLAHLVLCNNMKHPRKTSGYVYLTSLKKRIKPEKKQVWKQDYFPDQVEGGSLWWSQRRTGLASSWNTQAMASLCDYRNIDWLVWCWAWSIFPSFHRKCRGFLGLWELPELCGFGDFPGLFECTFSRDFLKPERMTEVKVGLILKENIRLQWPLKNLCM